MSWISRDLTIVIAHSLESDIYLTEESPSSTSLNSSLAERQFSWLLSALEDCRPAQERRIVVRYNPGDIIQGYSSGNSARERSTALLELLQEHRDGSGPIIFVGHGLGGTIIKHAIAAAARDMIKYRGIYLSTRLFLFLNCLHRATTQCEIVNRVARWLSPVVDPSSPTLLCSIEALASFVTEANEVFRETKITEFARAMSIYSADGNDSLAQITYSLGTVREKVVCIAGEKGDEKAEASIKDAAGTAATSLTHPATNTWLQVMHYLAPSAKPVMSPPHSNKNTISRILESDIYRNFRDSDPRLPLALSIHGSSASDVARSFCQAFEKEPMHGRRIALYFTFDRHDGRRNSALPMVNSFNAQILMASDTQWGKVNRGFDGRFDKRAPFRSWCLYDAMHVFACLTERKEILCVLNNVDQCEPESREQFLQYVRKTIMLTEDSFKLLLTAEDLLDVFRSWDWGSLDAGPDLKDATNDNDVPLENPEGSDGAESSTTTPPNEATPDLHNSDASSDALRHAISLLTAHMDPLHASNTELTEFFTEISDTRFRDMILARATEATSPLAAQKLLSLRLRKPITPQSFFRNLVDMIPESDRPLAQQVMAWVLCAFRPLSVQELAMVVAWLQRREFLGETSREKDYSLRLLSSVASLLWGFLAVEDNEVRISHPAVRELFLNGKGDEWFSVRERDHGRIVRLCLELLQLENFRQWEEENYGFEWKFEPESAPNFRSMYEDRSTLHRYIITYWQEHYRRSSITDRPRSEVKHFFDEENRPFWRSWAVAKIAMSNPLSLAERPEQSFNLALPFLAALGDADLLNDWLDSTATEPSSVDVSMALVQGAYVGSKEIVERILVLKDNESWKSGAALRDALIVAASYGHFEILLHLINTAPDGYAWPPSVLVRVSELGLKEAVQALLARKCPLNATTAVSPMTPLSRAALNGHTDICSLFLASRVKDSPDTASEPWADTSTIIDKDAIKLALKMTVNSPCGARVLKTLEQHGVDVLEKELNDYDALGKACLLGHFEVVEAFLDIARTTATIPAGIDDCLKRPVLSGRAKTAACLLDFIKEKKDKERAQEIMNEHLVAAVTNDREALVRVLLERGAEATGLLIEACSHKPVNMAIVKLLVKHGADIEAKNERATPLTKAAANGDLECVRYLVELGADVNVRGPQDTTPLMFAARGGYLSCVRCLLEHDAELNSRDKFGESALFEAAAWNHFEVAEFLLDRGADAAGRGWLGRNVLQMCLSSPATMKKVLERHPEVNMKDSDGLAPIHLAARGKRAAAIPILAQFGAEVDMAGPDEYAGHAPLAMAVLNEDLATVQNLLEAGADVDRTAKAHGCSALHHATRAEIIATLLQYGPHVDIADNDGKTALHHLTSTTPPDLAAIKTLVKARATVNVQDKNGCTPLFNIVLIASDGSSSTGHDLVVDYLLSKNADPNIPTLLNASPLREACKQGSLPLAKQLHAAGAKVDVGTGGLYGSPLQDVCLGVDVDRDAIEMIRFLVDEAKADVNYVCGRYGTALGAACMRGSPDVLNVLLDEYKADPRLPDWAGRLPLHLAASTQLSGFQQLAGLGCDDDAGVVDKTGRTVLHWAAQSGNVGMVELALSQTGGEVDEVDGDGWTALCWAARGPTLNPVGLQQQTESPNDWKTAASRQTDVIKLLLGRGAKKSVKVRAHEGEEQWTPRAIAAFHGLPATVVELLTEEPDKEATEDMKSHSSLQRGFRHSGVVCACCQSFVTGTRYSCKTCDGFDFCFKCYGHREDLAKDSEIPSHDFEAIGPAVDDSLSSDRDSSVTSVSSDYDSSESDF
ncbi:hypothetical protein DL770_009789 [Monosporascus sp. CRB-9-2]|nr:hypothetical protein DL770_009789 [Monosporascus sp. CRB-9-2]